MSVPTERVPAFYDHRPDWAEAVVLLIDALRDYIQADADVEYDARLEGWPISEEKRREHDQHMQAVKLLLKQFESYEVGCGGCEFDKRWMT